MSRGWLRVRLVLVDVALGDAEGRHGLERSQEVGAGLQEGLDQFRPRRLREQVVADVTVRPIDQAVAEDGMQGVELLLARIPTVPS